MTRVGLTLVSITLAAWLTACTDPGCIRNSECPTGYLCVNSVCMSPIDAGEAQPSEPTPPTTPNEDAGYE